MQRLRNIYQLGLKELISFRHDRVLVVLVLYTFTLAVYIPAKSAGQDVNNASIAIVDEDGSRLSQRIHDAFLPPYFLPPARLSIGDIDAAMDASRYTFVLDIPPDFQADILAGRQPVIQVNVDATAMSQAFNGAGYIRNILAQELNTFVHERQGDRTQPLPLAVRVVFNPNLQSGWFLGVMQIINNITVLAIVLTGAALIREREHGTIDHLLVMPLTPLEIMLAKVWANGLVIVIAATLSLVVIVMRLLRVPVVGSISLFLLGTSLYLFSATAIGIFLGIVARSMPQLGLLFIPTVMTMILLSGGNTPLDSMPKGIQTIMMFVPSTHFVEFATAVLFRGAGFDIVWRSIAAIVVIGAVFFLGALVRFPGECRRGADLTALSHFLRILMKYKEQAGRSSLIARCAHEAA